MKNTNAYGHSDKGREYFYFRVLTIIVITAGLYFSHMISYLLFHSLVELATIAIAFTLYTLTWNMRRLISSGSLMALGIGYGFISGIDLFHTLVYKGMGVFPEYGANLPTQLWIAARSLQAVLLCIAPLLARRKVSEKAVFAVSLASVSGVMLLVFLGGFPDCFIEGRGLTPFKIISEYVISAVLMVALFLFISRRAAFSRRIFLMIVASILCTLGSELAFTAYLSVYGTANMAGHFLKLAAFYFIYRALIVTGFREPFELIFRELKETEERLIRQQEFTHSLLESMADGVVACDENGTLTLFNRTSREWHGLDPMRLPPEEWARHYDLFRADGKTPLPTDEVPLAMAFRGEEVRDTGMAIVAAGQAPRFIVANGSEIKDAEGHKLGAVVVMHDITSLRRLEQELREINKELEIRVIERTAALRASEERYRMVFENSPVSIWEEDFSEVKVILDGLRSEGINDIENYFAHHPETVRKSMERVKIVDVNHAALSLHGARSKEELLTGLVNTFTSESFDMFRKELVCLWNRGNRIMGDAVVKKLTGELRNVTVYFSVCPGYEETLSKVIVSLIDITERKEAEEALRENEWRYREIFDNVLDGLYLLEVTADGGFRTIEVNPALERLTGIPRSFSVGKTQEETVPAEVAEIVNRKYRHCVEAGHPIEEEVRLDLPTGMKYVHSTLIPACDRKGKVYRIIGISRDITDQKKAEEELARYREELEERVSERTAELAAANKELEAFSYSVSHDLRSPLRHIDGFIELLKKNVGTALDEQGRQYMDTISTAANKMGELIDNLLSFSRLGRKKMSAKEVDLITIIHNIIKELEPEIAGREIQWRIEKLPLVKGDPSLLRVVMMNLISNAVKFTRPREKAIIEAGSESREETIFFIRDNGVGFDPEYADDLFGVFQRLHSADEFEGTGVGLAMVQRILHRHGGRVWAEGEPGKGAVFYFSLPLAAQSG